MALKCLICDQWTVLLPSMSFVSEAERFYCLMDTVDLGEEPPLDIVPLKENNPLKKHKTLIS